MARYKDRPWYVRAKNGRAYLEYRLDGRVRKSYLGIPYLGPERASPAERAAAERAGEARYRELTDGRVVEEDRRVRTTLTLEEAYSQYVEPFAPSESDDVNAREAKREKYTVLNSYGTSLARWAFDDAKRPDGTPRWRGDHRTPLQRVVADGAPENFLAWRLTQVKRKTMRKEKSNLVAFLAWCQAQTYLASVPEVKLPPGKGTAHPRMKKSGRGVDIRLTPEEAQRFCAVLPIWSRGRPGPKASGERRHISAAAERALEEPSKERFLVRPFYELMALTPLRPITLERLEVPRNWSKGRKTITLTDDDDKAKYGRTLPISSMAAAILETYAPPAGHIFGPHDKRKYVKAAAKLVFDDHRAALFGSYHLRHGMGTYLASRTTNLAAASYLMGHKDLTTTSVYVHAEEAEAKALVEATEEELRGLRERAAAWAAARLAAASEASGAPDSRPIRAPETAADSKSDAFYVGARGFEPPTPRPPAHERARKPGDLRKSGTPADAKKRAKAAGRDAIRAPFAPPVADAAAAERASLIGLLARAEADGDHDAVRVLSRRLAALTGDAPAPSSRPPAPLRAIKGGRS